MAGTTDAAFDASSSSQNRKETCQRNSDESFSEKEEEEEEDKHGMEVENTGPSTNYCCNGHIMTSPPPERLASKTLICDFCFGCSSENIVLVCLACDIDVCSNCVSECGKPKTLSTGRVKVSSGKRECVFRGW